MKVVRIFLVAIIAFALPLISVRADNADIQAKKDEPVLTAVLLGGNEVSDEGDANVGDPDARGAAIVLLERGRGIVCFGITVSGTDTPTAAHIHRASAGINGGILVTLTAPDGGNPGSSSGCVTGQSNSLINQIRNNPQGFYVNVHTTAFPAGAVRGQLN